MTCRFSIVIVRGNDVGQEEKTIHSLGKQRFDDCEVLFAAQSSAEAVCETVSAASGEFVVIVDSGDLLHRDALRSLDRAVEDDVDLVYTDEDVLSSGVHKDPFLKPGWSPDLLETQPYTGRLTALRTNVVRAVGGLHLESGSAYEYELVLRVSEAARRVVHVPRVLCHRPAPFAPSSRWVKDASDVLNGHFRRTGAQLTAVGDQPGGVQRDSVVVRANLRYAPSVSIIIPTAGVVRRIGSRTVPLVVNCVESIVERSTYASFDIVCVFDKPIDPGVRRALEHAAGDRIKLLPYEDTFNFARKVNVGALASTSEHLLFLNDDIEVSTPEWIEELFAYSTNPRVGAVGALLRFGDGRIQHAGVVLSGGHPGHSYYGFPGDHPGYHSNLRAASNITAVTAACLMTRRECFERVGGLSVAFPRNYNDVDFCLKLGAAGYRIVLNPRAQLLHYESSSRGFLPVEPEELELLQNRWGTRLLRDPYYNPNFLPGADFVTLVDPLGRTPAEAGLV